MALVVRNLRKAFRGLIAVDDVSFEAAPGEVVALIGPNGSGKSTVINLISGLLRPDSGTIEFVGRRLDGQGAVAVSEAGIARTFQNGRVFARLSVADNVELGLHKTVRRMRPGRPLADIPLLRWLHLLAETAIAIAPGVGARREARGLRARVDAELDRFGTRLGPRRDDPAYTLSYANRRRTEIARALAARPHVLLLDEPTAGMNPAETAEVVAQLLKLKAAGQTILLVEHKIDVVIAVSDRVLVMDNGRIIAAGKPNDVRQDPAVIQVYLGARRERASTRDAAVSPSPLLTANGLDVYYGSMHALRDVSLTVGHGEIVSLLGGNASGKSTTMKALLGLVALRRGDVIFDGRKWHGVATAKRVRAGIASVPEARRVFSDMTVAENLLVGAYTRRDRARVKADLDRVYGHFPRLYERRAQAAGTMSGGEQQMLAFGRALMSSPRLICMDEPTMGLAPRLVEKVLAEIVRLRDELGVAVLLVEQQAELALAIADRGYVLAQGAIALRGSARELLDDPAIQEAYLGRTTPETSPAT